MLEFLTHMRQTSSGRLFIIVTKMIYDKTLAFHKIAPANDDMTEINIIIEIPKGSLIKYEYDKDTGIIKADRYLFQETPFLYDYGLIPQTWMAGDDDPLDAILLTNCPGTTGTLVEAKLIGLVKIDDSGEKDDKLICVPLKDPRWYNINKLDDLSEHLKKEIQFFLEHYAALQPKKTVKVVGWGDVEEGKIILKEAIEEYKRKFDL